MSYSEGSCYHPTLSTKSHQVVIQQSSDQILSHIMQRESRQQKQGYESSQSSLEQNMCVLIRNLDEQKFEQQTSLQSLSKTDSATKITVIDELVVRSKSGTGTVIWKDYWQNHSKLSTTLLKVIMEGDVDKLRDILKQKTVTLNEFSYMDQWRLLHFVCNSNSPIQSSSNEKQKSTSSPLSSKSSVSSNHKSSLSPQSSLMKSIQDGHAFDEILDILLQNGCDIQAQTSIKRRPLHIAVLRNAYYKVQILLKHGCQINIIDDDFNTPLHYAAQFGYNDILQLIVNHCLQDKVEVDLTMKNNRRMTVLDICRDQRSKEIVQRILGSKAENLCRSYLTQQEGYQNNYYLSRSSELHELYLSSRSDHIQRFLSSSQDSFPSNHQNVISRSKNLKVVGSRCSLLRGSNPGLLQTMVEVSLQSYNESLNCQLIQSLKDYDKLRKLGQGSFGEVFLVRKKKSSKYFALKCLNKAQILQHKLKKYVYMERKVLLTIKNPFLVHAHSFFQDRNRLYIVMQLCYGGDLQSMIRVKKRLDQQTVKMYAAEVCLALGCLHQQDILFRDLKPANVLVDGEGHVKITDFGLAKQANVSYSFLGSKAYLPPQMLTTNQMKEHCSAIDWYLFGVLIYQLLIGRPPFYSHDQAKMFRNIREAKPDIPDFVSIHSRDLLMKLLEKNPKKRLGSKQDMEQVQRHPWFKEIDWEVVKDKKLPVPKPQVNFEDLKVKMFMQQQSLSENRQGDQYDKRFLNWNHYQPFK